MSEERKESGVGATLGEVTGSTGAQEVSNLDRENVGERGGIGQRAREYGQIVTEAANEAREYLRTRQPDRADDEAELSEAVENAIVEVERLRFLAQRDQAEIEQIKEETRRMISKLLAA